MAEIFNQDNEKMIRDFPFNLPYNPGFFGLNGEEGLNMRGIFTELFRKENIQSLFPKLKDIIQRHCQKLKDELKSGKMSHKFPEGYDPSCNFFPLGFLGCLNS